MERCQAPGCDNPTDRGICDRCDAWVDEQVAMLDRGGDLGDDIVMVPARSMGSVIPEIRFDVEYMTALRNAPFALYINIDKPEGWIPGREGILRALRRRWRSKRYSRSPAWRLRARKIRMAF